MIVTIPRNNAAPACQALQTGTGTLFRPMSEGTHCCTNLGGGTLRKSASNSALGIEQEETQIPTAWKTPCESVSHWLLNFPSNTHHCWLRIFFGGPEHGLNIRRLLTGPSQTQPIGYNLHMASQTSPLGISPKGPTEAEPKTPHFSYEVPPESSQQSSRRVSYTQKGRPVVIRDVDAVRIAIQLCHSQ